MNPLDVNCMLFFAVMDMVINDPNYCYVKHATFDQRDIAKYLGISKSRVSHIEKQAIAKLRQDKYFVAECNAVMQRIRKELE